MIKTFFLFHWSLCFIFHFAYSPVSPSLAARPFVELVSYASLRCLPIFLGFLKLFLASCKKVIKSCRWICSCICCSHATDRRSDGYLVPERVLRSKANKIMKDNCYMRPNSLLLLHQSLSHAGKPAVHVGVCLVFWPWLNGCCSLLNPCPTWLIVRTWPPVHRALWTLLLLLLFGLSVGKRQTWMLVHLPVSTYKSPLIVRGSVVSFD